MSGVLHTFVGLVCTFRIPFRPGGGRLLKMARSFRRRVAMYGPNLYLVELEVVSSTMPALGNLAIHGLTCNNELAP